MKIQRIIILAFFALAIASSAMAGGNTNQRSQWASQMLEYKHKMIVEETDMTPAQREKFMPIYEQMEQEIYDINAEARQLESQVSAKKNPSQSEYKQAADALSQAKVHEGEIEAKYYDKFSKILSQKQMFQLKHAENKFTKNMLTRKKSAKKD